MSSSIAMFRVLTFSFKRGHFNLARRGHFYFALTQALVLLQQALKAPKLSPTERLTIRARIDNLENIAS